MRLVASSACSAEMVTVVTCAPRSAARMASSPQPVPISSTRGAGGDAGGVEQPVDLAVLGGLQLTARSADVGIAVEHRGGVRHRRVQEQREQVVGQVVVALDVSAVSRWPPCCPACDGRGMHHRGAQAVAKDGGISVDIRPAMTVSTPARSSDIPVAGHVGLAEADQAT